VTRRGIAYLILVAAALMLARPALAQDLGGTAAAMGASSALEANPMRGQAQVNRAAAISGQQQPQPPAATPAAQPAAVQTINAVNAAGAPVAPAGAPGAAPATGQQTPAQKAAADAAAATAAAAAAADIHTPFKQSFFFTAEDIIAIHKAIEQQGTTDNGNSSVAQAAQQAIPAVRRIALSGVIYKAADDWLIWINGQKVTPKVQMKEIVEIEVERELVHLKWFDIGLNGVIDITMRPNETYDIVTGVLLPGVMK
jgi:hypothetical protein